MEWGSAVSLPFALCHGEDTRAQIYARIADARAALSGIDVKPYCTHSSSTVQQHYAHNANADAWIIPIETCKQAHLLPTALVLAGGLANTALHVSAPHHTQHTWTTVCTHTLAGSYLPLTGWNNSSPAHFIQTHITDTRCLLLYTQIYPFPQTSPVLP